jgi:hypothetical protein
MLLLTRESLVSHLLELSEVIDLYATGDPRFIPECSSWLHKVEGTLGKLRSPLVSKAATERGRLLAYMDGYREAGAPVRQHSSRREVRAAAWSALSSTEAVLRAAVTEIDGRLAGLREKLAQYLAVSSSAQPLPLPSDGEDRNDYLRRVWSSLSAGPETKNMRSYLCASLAQSDRMLLLGEVVDNLLSTGSPE